MVTPPEAAGPASIQLHIRTIPGWELDFYRLPVRRRNRHRKILDHWDSQPGRPAGGCGLRPGGASLTALMPDAHCSPPCGSTGTNARTACRRFATIGLTSIQRPDTSRAVLFMTLCRMGPTHCSMWLSRCRARDRLGDAFAAAPGWLCDGTCRSLPRKGVKVDFVREHDRAFLAAHAMGHQWPGSYCVIPAAPHHVCTRMPSCGSRLCWSSDS